jgi:hypothetical protein
MSNAGWGRSPQGDVVSSLDGDRSWWSTGHNHLALMMLLVATSMAGEAWSAQSSVGGGGQFVASYEVSVPPGVNGLAPAVSLVYSGDSRGIAGHGWSLRAASTIVRCPTTRAVDNRVGHVRFEADDKLCLDGARLIQTDGQGEPLPFPQSGDAAVVPLSQHREFRPEGNAQLRVRAYGSHSVNETIGWESRVRQVGPTHLKAWTATGQVLEFGLLQDLPSPAVLSIVSNRPSQAWPLRRVTDASGNQMVFDYEGDANQWRLSAIRYGGGTSSPRHAVRFHYEAFGSGEAALDAWHMGARRILSHRLKEVSTESSGQTISRHILTYSASASTGRRLLQSIARCAADGQTCLPPSEFTYTASAVGFALNEDWTRDSDGMQNGLASLPLHFQPVYGSTSGQEKFGLIQGDFNGDGRPDILRWSDVAANNRLWLSEGTGNYRERIRGSGVGQFNLNTEHLFLSSDAIVTNGWSISPSVYIGHSDVDFCYLTTVADFNGDGLDDLLRAFGKGECIVSDQQSYLFLSRGDGSFEKRTAEKTSGGALQILRNMHGSWSNTLIHNHQRYYVLDFDRDGRADILQFSAGAAFEGSKGFAICETYVAQSCGATAWISQEDGRFAPQQIQFVVPVGRSSPSEELPGGSVTRWRSDLGRNVTYSVFVPLDRRPNGASFAWLEDVNGDGAVDLTIHGGGRNYSYLGTGTSQMDYAGEGTPVFPSSALYGDFNGDGRPDRILTPGTHGLEPPFWGGAGSFGQPAQPALHPTMLWDFPFDMHRLLATDVDDDGLTDVLWIAGGGNAWFKKGRGDGLFEPNRSIAGGPTYEPGSGSSVYLSGNFSGRSPRELFLVGSVPSKLYSPASDISADLLSAVKTPNGSVTSVEFRRLTRDARYASDRGTTVAAIWPLVDTTPPRVVVHALERDSGVGSEKVVTQYAYRGFREDNSRLADGYVMTWQIEESGFVGDSAGRRSVGFRELRRESLSPDGTSRLTTRTLNVQRIPYAGMPSSVEAYVGAMSPVLQPQGGLRISREEYIYCDQSVGAGVLAAASVDAPCPTSAKVFRTYLRQKRSSKWGLDGTALPVTTATTTMSGGYPVLVENSTEGLGPAGPQSFVRRVESEYWPDQTQGEQWILGRVKRSVERSTVPNALSATPASAGTSPNATKTAGP